MAAPAGRLRRAAPAVVAVLCCTASAVVAACQVSLPSVPLDGPVFPTGVAVSPDGTSLAVVSSDFDKTYLDGALLLADLDAARSTLVAQNDPATVIAAPYTSAVLLPPFGERPVFSSDGAHLYVPVRGVNAVAVVDVLTDGSRRTLRCSDETPSRCGDPPRVLELRGNDPERVLLLAQEPARIDGLVTLLSSPVVTFFRHDIAAGSAGALTVLGTVNIGDDLAGLRAAALLPAGPSGAATVFGTADFASSVGVTGAVLVGFAASVGAVPTRLDVTAVTGALSARDVVLVPGAAHNSGVDALVVALRAPDALARFEIDRSAATPRLQLSALAATCRQPTHLAAAAVPTADGLVDRVLVTCQDGETVEAVDPETLRATGAVRFFGRTPYDVAIASTGTPPVALVSFFLDNSVGVLVLVDTDGHPALLPVGRLGEALPRPEDGRD